MNLYHAAPELMIYGMGPDKARTKKKRRKEKIKTYTMHTTHKKMIVIIQKLSNLSQSKNISEIIYEFYY